MPLYVVWTCNIVCLFGVMREVFDCHFILCGPVILCLLHCVTERVEVPEGRIYFPRGPYVGQPFRSTCKLGSRSANCPPACGNLFIAVFTLLRFLSPHIFIRCFSEVTLTSSSHPLRLSG